MRLFKKSEAAEEYHDPYYDDVEPIPKQDGDRKLNKDLILKVSLVIVGVIAIITVAVILISLL